MTGRQRSMASRSFDYTDSRNTIVDHTYQLRVPVKLDSTTQNDRLHGSTIARSAYEMSFGLWGEQSKQIHAGIIALVLVAHGALLWALLDARLSITYSQPYAPLTLMPASGHYGTQRVVISIEPNAIEFQPINLEQPTVPGIKDDLLKNQTSPNDGKVTPPVAALPLPDLVSFARQMGITSGQGGTVVLRIEIHGNGAVGRVEVEVSGGNPTIDRAAVAYVRSVKWVGGRKDDKPETLWIRWGVLIDG
jgi:TonB family protein